MKNKMNRWVRRDYWKAFRWSDIKEKSKTYSVNWVLAVCWSMIWFFVSDWFSEEGACCFAIMIPILLAYFSHTLHQSRPSKILYICPLTADERKAYIVKSMKYSIRLHFFVGIAGAAVVLILRPYDWLLAIAVLMNMSFMSYYSCGKSENAGKEKYSEHAELESGARLVSFAGGMVYSLIIVWTTADGISPSVAWWIELVILCIGLCVQISIFITCRKNREADIADACHYEGGCV